MKDENNIMSDDHFMKIKISADLAKIKGMLEHGDTAKALENLCLAVS